MHRTGAMLVLVTVCAVATSGCRGPIGGVGSASTEEILESRLRVQEQQISDLQGQLERTENDLKAAQRRSDDLQARLSRENEIALVSEQHEALFQVTEITINPMLTGGLNRDGEPGDDLLSVMVIPRDENGDPVKLPGRITFELHDMTLAESERRLGRWKFSPTEMREHWQSGFVGNGFRFQLPWQQKPRNSTLLIHARLNTPDGRQFDATHEVRIQPADKATFVQDAPAVLRSGHRKRTKIPDASRNRNTRAVTARIPVEESLPNSVDGTRSLRRPRPFPKQPDAFNASPRASQ